MVSLNTIDLSFNRLAFKFSIANFPLHLLLHSITFIREIMFPFAFSISEADDKNDS